MALTLPSQPAPAAFAQLERRGRPALTLPLKDAYDLGAQFFLWEVATAAAGFILGVDPFDGDPGESRCCEFGDAGSEFAVEPPAPGDEPAPPGLMSRMLTIQMRSFSSWASQLGEQL